MQELKLNLHFVFNSNTALRMGQLYEYKIGGRHFRQIPIWT